MEENKTLESETSSTIDLAESTQLKTSVLQATSTSTLSLTPTVSFSFTPMPTLLKEEASKKVLELLTDKSNCLLPCWWNIYPGRTTWVEANQFLSTFATEIEQGGSKSEVIDGITYKHTNYSISYEIYGSKEGGGINLGVSNGIIDSILIGSNSTRYNLQMAQILTKYGYPESIYISTYRDAPDYPPPFILVLYYPKFKFLASFETDAQLVGENIVGCVQTINPIIDIWESNTPVTTNEIENRTIGYDSPSHLQELTSVSKLSVDDFYNIYKDPNNAKCIETGIENWP